MKTEQQLIGMAVASYRQGESKRWLTCHIAAKGMDGGTTGFVEALSFELALSRDSVEKLAQAWVTYHFFLHSGMQPKSERFPSHRSLRDALSIKHYQVMGRLMRKYEIAPEDALQHLVDAAENRVSVESLKTAVDGQQNPGEKEWLTRLRVLVQGLRLLSNDYGIPDDLRSLTRQYLLDIHDYLEE